MVKDTYDYIEPIVQCGHVMLSEESYTSLSLGATCCTLTSEQEIIVDCFLFLKQEVEHTHLLQSSSAPRMAVPPPGTYFPLPQAQTVASEERECPCQRGSPHWILTQDLAASRDLGLWRDATCYEFLDSLSV